MKKIIISILFVIIMAFPVIATTFITKDNSADGPDAQSYAEFEVAMANAEDLYIDVNSELWENLEAINNKVEEETGSRPDDLATENPTNGGDTANVEAEGNTVTFTVTDESGETRIAEATLPATIEELFLTADTVLDSDEDGLTNFEELYVLGTDPDEADTDGDSYSDGWEVDNGYDPTDADSHPPDAPEFNSIYSILIVIGASLILLVYLRKKHNK